MHAAFNYFNGCVKFSGCIFHDHDSSAQNYIKYITDIDRLIIDPSLLRLLKFLITFYRLSLFTSNAIMKREYIS